MNANGIYHGNNNGHGKMKYVKSDKNLLSANLENQEFKSGNNNNNSNKNWKGGFNGQTIQGHLGILLNAQNSAANNCLNLSGPNSNSNSNSNNNINLPLGLNPITLNNSLNANGLNIGSFNSSSSNRNNNSNSVNNNNNFGAAANKHSHSKESLKGLNSKKNNYTTINSIMRESGEEQMNCVEANEETSANYQNSNLSSNSDNNSLLNQMKTNAPLKKTFIKIVVKLNNERLDIIEIQKDDDILAQANNFCVKNNLNTELIKPIYNYIQQSLNTLGIVMEKKVDSNTIESLKFAKNQYEEMKELESNYHSDSEIYVNQFNNCDVSTLDSNTSY